MNNGITVTLSDISSLETLRGAWQDFDERGDGSFFTSWAWIGTWLSVLPSSFVPQLVWLVRDQRRCGVAVAVRRRVLRRGLIPTRQIHLNQTGDPRYDCLTIEHNGFAGAVPPRFAWPALLRWFASGAAEADELIIPGLAGVLLEQHLDGSLLRETREPWAYRVDLGRVRDAGGATGNILSANARQQLTRAKRRLAALGAVTFEAAEDVGQAFRFLDRMKELHVRSWARRGQRHGFYYPVVDRFHRRLIEHCMPGGEVQLLRLRAGSREVAYLYNFRRNGVVYAYQSGIDDAEPQLRPGYVAHALAIERFAESGETTYDFLAGSNRLKQSFATERYAMHWYMIQRPLLRFRAEQIARNVKRLVAGSAYDG